MNTKHKSIHPVWLRIMHWLNALAVIVLILSGWRIYNATSFFGFDIPGEITLGKGLAGALQWHFTAMWVLGINGLLYLTVNVVSGRLLHKFLPLAPKTLLAELAAAFTGRLSHADPQHYNMPQRVAYLFVMLDSVLLVDSGLVLWKSVQFPLLRELLFGYEGARFVHFFAMAAMALFLLIHLVMVALVPRTLLYMTRGH
jgi:thiosulfate reductase cytochrome b subunit